jgi:DUF4097 and DUF4098 domain-containing protein YvlB
MPMKNLARCVLASAVLASAACTVDVQGMRGEGVVVREQRRIPLTGTPNVSIRTFNGSIGLQSWERNEILVDIERRAETAADAREIEVETSEAGGNVIIEAKRTSRRGFRTHFGSRSPGVRLTVTVPRALTLEARTGDGSIDARDLSGRVELRTGDGAVRLQRIDGDITVSTGDGSVAARELGGVVTVTTGDGSVEMSGRFAGLTARTGDGSVGIDALPGSTMQRDWTVTSGDGGVMIRLPSDFNADVDARTGDGVISTTGVALTRTTGEGERRRVVRGRVGAGGEELNLRTGDGSIRIVAR